MVTIQEQYPFAKEVIKDENGNVTDIVLEREQYFRLIEELEDEGLYRAMKEVENEKPMSIEEALKQLEDE